MTTQNHTTIKPIVYVADYASYENTPWKIANLGEKRFCTLDASISLEEVGLFIAELARYTQVTTTEDKDVTVKALLENIDETLVSGGVYLQFDEAREIWPGCCCGLESWWEWVDFLEKNNSPWMGHDPSGELVRQTDGTIVVCGNTDYEPEAFTAELTQTNYQQLVKQLANDLVGFLKRLQDWTEKERLAEGKHLVEAIDKRFCITKTAQMLS